MAAIIDIFEKMNPVFISQNGLQPLPTHFITRGADEVDQIRASGAIGEMKQAAE